MEGRLREGGIDGRGWAKEAAMEASDGGILSQLRAEKLHSALFNWLPQLQTRLINFGLLLISHLEKSQWHFRSKPAPFLSVKTPFLGESSCPAEEETRL